MLVQNILQMKPEGPVITIAPNAKVADAVQLLSERRIGAVVVSENGDVPLGILSERDIVRELGRRGPECLTGLVSEMMTSLIVTCGPEMTVDQVMAEMTRGRFRHMPVQQGDRMIGLISIGDVVKARIEDLAHEKDALQDMIMGR